MNNRQYRILETSDWHLGNRNTPTLYMLANLRKIFTIDLLSSVDIVLLGGDIFDKELYFPNTEVHEIQIWISEFLTICAACKCMVRILEGTPSHDRKQSRIFDIVNTIANIGVDLKYFDDIAIEYIAKYDITILYIPDEIRASPEITYNDVLALMEVNNLAMVDYALMHGNFEHQLPPHVKKPCHIADRYIKLVRKLIFTGHIHLMSMYLIILSAGSLERISHGEESPKGYFVVTDSKDGAPTVKFIHNDLAMRYVTFTITNEYDIDGLINDLNDFNPGEHVRVMCPKDPVVISLIEQVKRGFPLLKWKVVIDHPVDDTNKLLTVKAVSSYHPVQITKENIADLLREKMKHDNDERADRAISLCRKLTHCS